MAQTPETGTRHTGAIATLMVLLLIVLMVVFAYIRRLSDEAVTSGDEPFAPAAEVTMTAAQALPDGPEPTPPQGTAGAVGATPVDSSAPRTGPLPTQPDPGAQIVTYRDPRHGFEMQLLDSWRVAAVDGPAAPARASDYDAVFEQPDTGTRLAVSLWDTPSLDALNLWVTLVAPDMQSVDGSWPTNATVAGVPALVVWRDESPTAPARYATFLAREGRLYRIAYSAADGGALTQEYLRALVTFALPGDEDTSDTVPPLPRPAGRYYPSTALFDPPGR